MMSASSEVQTLKQKISLLEDQNSEQARVIISKDEEIGKLNNKIQSLNGDIVRLKTEKAEAVGGRAPGFNPWAKGAETEDVPEQYRKLFVGGLNYSTDKEALHKYFSKYGEILEIGIAKNKQNQSRGFGFVIYKTVNMVDAAQDARPHRLDGRKLNPTRALNKEDSQKPENLINTKRLFVGDLPRDAKESDIREVFREFDDIESVGLQTTSSGENKGFCIINFSDYDIVDKLNLIKYIDIKGTRCEMKKAKTRDREKNFEERRSSKSYSRVEDDFPSQRSNSQSYSGMNQTNQGYSYGQSSYQGYSNSGYGNPNSSYGSQSFSSPSYGSQSYGQSYAQPDPPPVVNQPAEITSHDPKPVSSKEAQALAAYYSILAKGGSESDGQAGGPIRGSGGFSNRSTGPYSNNGGGFNPR